jgi:hypothetical protein
LEDTLKFIPRLYLNPISEKDVNLYTTTSSTPARVSVPPQNQVDYVLLASVNTSTQSLAISAWRSIDFEKQLNVWAFEKERDISELKSVVLWQKKCLTYQSIYSAFLLGILTEEEFEHDSEEYTSDIRDVTKEEILSTVDRLNRLLEFKFTVFDFANYLQTDPSVVSDAIESTNDQIRHFSPTLPYVGK